MDLQYWVEYQSHQVEHFIFVVGASLLAILYSCISLHIFRRNETGKIGKWLGLRPETVASYKIAHLMFSSLLTLVGIVLSAFLFVFVAALKTDLNQGLPSVQSTGGVSSEFVLFHGRSYAVIDGQLYTYVNSLPNAPLREGEQYQLTYLKNSREIFRITRIPD